MPGAVKMCMLKLQKAVVQQLNMHWVKFMLKDDKGKPMPDVKVKVLLPDKKIELATSDGTGLIYIKNLSTAGNCTLDLTIDGQNVNNTVFIQ